MKITIPKPCHENWDLMTPTEKGRFCAVCTKVVRDFTECTDDEIISEISNTEEKICGNFRTNQLNRNLGFSFVNSLFTKFAVGFVLTSAGLEKVSAQKTCDTKKDTLKEHRLKGDVVMTSPIKQDTIDRNLVLGKVAAKPIKDYEPLYILDGKIISYIKFKELDQKKIKKVEVLKDKKATDLYGKKAKNGVVIISTKDQTSQF